MTLKLDVSLLFNFILNQLLNNDEENANESTSYGSNLGQNSSNVERPVENYMKPLLHNKYLATLTALQEFGEIFRRIIDKNYAESRKYKNFNNGGYEGRVAVITDGIDPIGAQIVLYLSQIGFKKVIVGKNTLTIDANESQYEANNINVLKLDLSSLESVRYFAKEVTKLEPRIDLLINSCDSIEKHVLTDDGIEKNFQQNYLGHFLLTNLLIPHLEESINGRVINISSIAHYLADKDFDYVTNVSMDIPMGGYAQSKLATVLFTRELSRRVSHTNITTYVVSPEIIKKVSNIESNPILGEMLSKITDPIIGCQTMLYVSLEDSLKKESGYYYNNLQRVDPLLHSGSDDIMAKKLWELSESLVK